MSTKESIEYICESIACGKSDDDIALDLIAPSDDDLINYILGGE